MSGGSGILLALVSLGNILACLWLIWWTSKRRPGEEAEGAEKNHVWDGDLRELNNPLPRWWLNSFIITIVFGVGYLVVYPGLGAFAGTFEWSSAKQHDERLAEVEARRQAAYAAFEGRDLAELATDPSAAQIGGRLYGNNCAGCHGTDARGAVGFPNLTDSDWLYGGAPEAILTSITNGRAGMMPSMAAAVGGDAGVELVARYVQNLGDLAALSEADRTAGAQKFAICAGCHGPAGKGNLALGAPNLADDIWLYGGDLASIKETIVNGRNGQMPAHAKLLSEQERRLLAAYVYRLSGGDQR